MKLTVSLSGLDGFAPRCRKWVSLNLLLVWKIRRENRLFFSLLPVLQGEETLS
jgi:hypothetical protein